MNILLVILIVAIVFVVAFFAIGTFFCSEFLKITKVLSEGKIAEAEAMADNMQLKIFKDDRNDMFSVAPIAGFYLAKLTEIKSVKLILAAKKNGVDKQQLRVRLRELYA